jgi:outer membrane protein OmpA-like peptidoglycan-associated protein
MKEALFPPAPGILPGHGTAVPARTRRQLLMSCACATLLLAACQTPPPATAPVATPPAAEQREAELQRLGFKRTDEGWEFSFPGKLLFDIDSDALDADNQLAAEKIAKGLQQLGIDSLRIEGHTDNVGPVPHNQALSLKRAEAVARALVAAGLPPARLRVRGLGKDNPVADNGTPEGRLQNRRVAVIVPSL